MAREYLYRALQSHGRKRKRIDKSIKYGQSYGDLPTPTKAGYKFEGWYTSSSGGTKIYSSDTFVFTEDIELYARWSPATYTVSFNSNGGSSVSSISVKYGDTYGTLPTPKKDYYKFVGWYTSPSGGTKVSSGDTFNSASNITLYAQWQQNPISGWVEESKVPAGAQKVEYAYTYTETKESKSANEAKMVGNLPELGLETTDRGANGLRLKLRKGWTKI